MDEHYKKIDNQGLFLNKRQISWFLSVVLLLGFFVFITGYFLGKKKAAEQFLHTVDHDALADNVHATLYSMQHNAELAMSTEPVQESIVPEQPLQEAQEDKSKERPQEDVQYHYAQLVGFGTEQAARQCANRLMRKDMPVIVHKRQSKTAKGKQIAWYQVVTEKMSDKDALLKLVDSIKKEENIKDVRVVSC